MAGLLHVDTMLLYLLGVYPMTDEQRQESVDLLARAKHFAAERDALHAEIAALSEAVIKPFFEGHAA